MRRAGRTPIAAAAQAAGDRFFAPVVGRTGSPDALSDAFAAVLGLDFPLDLEPAFALTLESDLVSGLESDFESGLVLDRGAALAPDPVVGFAVDAADGLAPLLTPLLAPLLASGFTPLLAADSAFIRSAAATAPIIPTTARITIVMPNLFMISSLPTSWLFSVPGGPQPTTPAFTASCFQVLPARKSRQNFFLPGSCG